MLCITLQSNTLKSRKTVSAPPRKDGILLQISTISLFPIALISPLFPLAMIASVTPRRSVSAVVLSSMPHVDCPQVRSLSIGSRCFRLCKEVTIERLNVLQTIEIASMSFDQAATIRLIGRDGWRDEWEFCLRWRRWYSVSSCSTGSTVTRHQSCR